MEKLKTDFNSIEEKIKYILENKDAYVSEKKAAVKHADGYGIMYQVSSSKDKANKADKDNNEEEDVLTVKAIINTTKLMDSHDDVHIDGLWKKTLQENKRIKHLQEHNSREFKGIISDGEDLKAYTKDFAWKDLGFEKEGSTQALVFDSKVRKSRNPFMYNQYKNGWVDNHSVGMRYVKIEFAADPAKYEDEEANAVFMKHIEDIANKEDVYKQGYFWAVYEAKAIEGSAVPDGSNSITPTMEVKLPSENKEEENNSKAKKEAWLKMLDNI